MCLPAPLSAMQEFLFMKERRLLLGCLSLGLMRDCETGMGFWNTKVDASAFLENTLTSMTEKCGYDEKC